jgi:hypothetical protein
MILQLTLLRPRIPVVYLCSILLIQLNERSKVDGDHEIFEQTFYRFGCDVACRCVFHVAEFRREADAEYRSSLVYVAVYGGSLAE